MPAATTEAPIAVPGPSWVVAEMPPGYQNRVAEIERIADRVVLVTNADPSRPLEERAAALTPDALAFLTRMGAGHVTASTLFALWKQLLGDPARARAQVERLYSSPPGTFELSAAPR